MAIPIRQRKTLLATANRLKPTLSVGESEPTDAVVAHVRDAMKRVELLKVRIVTDDRNACRAAAEAIAARVPCELVQVIGRVAVLYRPLENNDGPTRGA